MNSILIIGLSLIIVGEILLLSNLQKRKAIALKSRANRIRWENEMTLLVDNIIARNKSDEDRKEYLETYKRFMESCNQNN